MRLLMFKPGVSEPFGGGGLGWGMEEKQRGLRVLPCTQRDFEGMHVWTRYFAAPIYAWSRTAGVDRDRRGQ